MSSTGQIISNFSKKKIKKTKGEVKKADNFYLN